MQKTVSKKTLILGDSMLNHFGGISSLLRQIFGTDFEMKNQSTGPQENVGPGLIIAPGTCAPKEWATTIVGSPGVDARVEKKVLLPTNFGDSFPEEWHIISAASRIKNTQLKKGGWCISRSHISYDFIATSSEGWQKADVFSPACRYTPLKIDMEPKNHPSFFKGKSSESEPNLLFWIPNVNFNGL